MLSAVLGGLPLLVHAQAGPPLITNDPDTPGPGAWEINLAATGAYAGGILDLDAPDIDINHGVGERVQLSLHTGWAHRRDGGDDWVSGAGPVELGVRWRFLDQEQAGVSVALQPLWISSFSRSAERKGLAPSNDEFVLPLQVARHFTHAAAGVEVARHFIAHEPDSWQAGVYGEYDCGPTLQCLAEVNATWGTDEGTRTVVNVGARKSLGSHLNLLGSLGREVVVSQPASDAQTVFYVGAQLLY